MPASVDVQRTTAWLRRQMCLTKSRWSVVAAEFNRYAPKPIEIAHTGVRNVEISGVFATDEPRSIRCLPAQPQGCAARSDHDAYSRVAGPKRRRAGVPLTAPARYATGQRLRTQWELHEVRSRHRSVGVATVAARVVRALSICAPVAVLDTPPTLAQTFEHTSLAFEIPARPLAEALAAFAARPACNSSMSPVSVRNRRSHAAAAGLSPDEALTRFAPGHRPALRVPHDA